MLGPENETEVEVRKEDQLKINEFGRLNNRLLELRSELNFVNKAMQQLEAAEEEVMMADDSDSTK